MTIQTEKRRELESRRCNLHNTSSGVGLDDGIAPNNQQQELYSLHYFRTLPSMYDEAMEGGVLHLFPHLQPLQVPGPLSCGTSMSFEPPEALKIER